MCDCCQTFAFLNSFGTRLKKYTKRITQVPGTAYDSELMKRSVYLFGLFRKLFKIANVSQHSNMLLRCLASFTVEFRFSPKTSSKYWFLSKKQLPHSLSYDIVTLLCASSTIPLFLVHYCKIGKKKIDPLLFLPFYNALQTKWQKARYSNLTSIHYCHPAIPFDRLCKHEFRI